MKKIFVIISTNVFEFDVDTKVECYADEKRARERFAERIEEIEADGAKYFGDIGEDDSEYCDGCRERGKDFFGIHKCFEAAMWDENVRIVEKEIFE